MKVRLITEKVLISCWIVWQAVAKIRAMGATAVKIVGVSADFGGRQAFMEAGADVFVPKPVKLETLEAMLEVVICKKNMSG